MPGKKHGESTFGEPLPNLRKDRGLTPVQLAETEARRQWKWFPMIATLPGCDQNAVIRLINTLAAAGPVRKYRAQGENHG